MKPFSDIRNSWFSDTNPTSVSLVLCCAISFLVLGLVLCLVIFCLVSCLVSSCFCVVFYCLDLSLISYPDLLMTKAKVESGQVRKFRFLDWLDCERMTRMLSPARAMACAQKVILCKVFSSVQKNIFT